MNSLAFSHLDHILFGTIQEGSGPMKYSVNFLLECIVKHLWEAQRS